MAFSSAEHVRVTRYLVEEKREDIQSVLAGSWKDVMMQVDDGRECSHILMEKISDAEEKKSRE